MRNKVTAFFVLSSLIDSPCLVCLFHSRSLLFHDETRRPQRRSSSWLFGMIRLTIELITSDNWCWTFLNKKRLMSVKKERRFFFQNKSLQFLIVFNEAIKEWKRVEMCLKTENNPFCPNEIHLIQTSKKILCKKKREAN